MAYKVLMGEREFHGLRGNLHMHTPWSDGTKTHRELARIAGEAGLDFIVVTDHNVYEPGHDGWVDGVLVLVGEEVHDPNRQPQSSHLLCFDIQQDAAGLAADPQAVVDAVDAQGGFTFLAHPFERDVADFLPEPNISWRDWDVTGYAGIELWNYMSEFKAVLKNKALAVLHAYFPALSISGPYPEALEKWDGLLQSRPVAAFGGSDAHGTVYHLGPLSKAVQPYDYLFRCVNTHLLSEDPLTGDLERDKAIVYGALRRGQGFLGYEQPGPIAGFAFSIESGGEQATMGETLTLRCTAKVRVCAPGPARFRLLRNGKVVAQDHGDSLTLMTPHPGVYRVEGHRRYWGRWQSWILSNPIYVD